MQAVFVEWLFCTWRVGVDSQSCLCAVCVSRPPSLDLSALLSSLFLHFISKEVLLLSLVSCAGCCTASRGSSVFPYAFTQVLVISLRLLQLFLQIRLCVHFPHSPLNSLFYSSWSLCQMCVSFTHCLLPAVSTLDTLVPRFALVCSGWLRILTLWWISGVWTKVNSDASLAGCLVLPGPHYSHIWV